MKQNFFHAVIGASVFTLLLAPIAAAGTQNITDATGRKVEIGDTSRIVTIGAAVTEIVYALGFGDRVVAIDLTSTYPAAATEKPSIGYMRTLSPEGVMSLTPTLVLAIEGSGPPDAIAVLSAASVPFVIVPDTHDETGVLQKVRFIANALGVSDKGEAMTKVIAEDFAALAAMRARIAQRRNAVFVLAAGNGSPTVAGKGTSAEGILKLAGVDNAIKDVTGFKPASPEATLAAQPQVVITMLERNHGLGAETMFALPAFAGTPAAANKRLFSIPSYYLTFGPRAAHAARDLAASVYPELTFPQLPARPWASAQSSAER